MLFITIRGDPHKKIYKDDEFEEWCASHDIRIGNRSNDAKPSDSEFTGLVQENQCMLVWAALEAGKATHAVKDLQEESWESYIEDGMYYSPGNDFEGESIVVTRKNPSYETNGRYINQAGLLGHAEDYRHRQHGESVGERRHSTMYRRPSMSHRQSPDTVYRRKNANMATAHDEKYLDRRNFDITMMNRRSKDDLNYYQKMM
jgi:hypothetical protein